MKFFSKFITCVKDVSMMCVSAQVKKLPCICKSQSNFTTDEYGGDDADK